MDRRIQNIILDVGNVLVDWNPRRLSEQIFHGVEEQEIAFEHVFNNDDWFKGDRGLLSMQAFEQLLGKDLPQRDFYVVHEAVRVFPHIVPIRSDENKWAVEMAKKGYRIFLLTNFNAKFPIVLNRMPVCSVIRGYVCSSDVKMVKPDRRIYQELIRKYDLCPNECLFIDDSLPNIQTASELGFHAIHYTDGIGQLPYPL